MSDHPRNLYVSNEDYEWLLDYLNEDDKPYIEESFSEFLNNIRLTGLDMKLGSLPSKDGLSGSFISQAAEGFAIAHGQDLCSAIPEYMGDAEIWSCDANKIFDKYLRDINVSRNVLDDLRAKDEHTQQMESLLVDAFEVYEKAREGDEDNINPPYSVEEVKDVYRGDVSVELLDEAYAHDHPRNLWVEHGHESYADDMLRFDGKEFCGLYAHNLFIAEDDGKAELFGIHSGVDYKNEGEIIYYAEPLESPAEADVIFGLVSDYLDQGIGELSDADREKYSRLIADAQSFNQVRDKVDIATAPLDEGDYLSIDENTPSFNYGDESLTMMR